MDVFAVTIATVVEFEEVDSYLRGYMVWEFWWTKCNKETEIETETAKSNRCARQINKVSRLKKKSRDIGKGSTTIKNFRRKEGCYHLGN